MFAVHRPTLKASADAASLQSFSSLADASSGTRAVVLALRLRHVT
jgi:hypothetical protein